MGNEWSTAGWQEEQTREYSFQKLVEEIRLDYEQLEAERDLFATSEDCVHFALHPQLAEQQEETHAGKQSFSDFQMRGNRYARYVKKERLAQAQNENRRKIFLERWKHYSYLRGYEPTY